MKHLSLVLLSIFAISCSDDKDGKDGDQKAQGAIVPQEIQGEWRGACAGTTFMGSAYSTRELFILGPDSADVMSMHYADSLECAGTGVPISRTIYSITETGISLIEGSHDYVNMIMEQSTLKPATDNETILFNQIKLCGFEDWQTGKDKNIAGATCSGNKIPNVGSPYYSIYFFDGPTIKVGTSTPEFDGSTPEKRHQKFGSTYVR